MGRELEKFDPLKRNVPTEHRHLESSVTGALSFKMRLHNDVSGKKKDHTHSCAGSLPTIKAMRGSWMMCGNSCN